jgi:hypothetical protein
MLTETAAGSSAQSNGGGSDLSQSFLSRGDACCEASDTLERT